jgi:hypothetical protein
VALAKGELMHHIPAIHAAKVGMRYPARVKGVTGGGLLLELDLSGLAPGRSPRLAAFLTLIQTVHLGFANELRLGDWIEVVLIECPGNDQVVCASLPADPAWLTWNNGTVRQLAQRIRETGEYDLLPILADALEEAGCAEPDLLARCRAPEGDTLDWLVTLLATQE